jgi:hypothetical protein
VDCVEKSRLRCKTAATGCEVWVQSARVGRTATVNPLDELTLPQAVTEVAQWLCTGLCTGEPVTGGTSVSKVSRKKVDEHAGFWCCGVSGVRKLTVMKAAGR